MYKNVAKESSSTFQVFRTYALIFAKFIFELMNYNIWGSVTLLPFSQKLTKERPVKANECLSAYKLFNTCS